MYRGRYLRVFAGLPLPDAFAQKLGGWIEACHEKYPRGLSLVKPANLHITLYFYGEKKAEEVKELVDCLASFQPAAIPASLGELGCFPNPRRARVFYIGLKQGQAEVTTLYQAFLKQVAPLGYLAEDKEFKPHLTFARNKDLQGIVTFPDFGQFIGSNFIFDRVVLFESRLKPGGAEYIPLKTVVLK
jgi:2'-5' RNA ligase